MMGWQTSFTQQSKQLRKHWPPQPSETVPIRQAGQLGTQIQLPFTHSSPAMQPAAVPQLAGHVAAVPLHTKGEQLGLPGEPVAFSLHWPTELHESQAPPHSESQHTPSTQKPVEHWFLSTHP